MYMYMYLIESSEAVLCVYNSTCAAQCDVHMHVHVPDSKFLMALALARARAVTHLCLSTSFSARR